MSDEASGIHRNSRISTPAQREEIDEQFERIDGAYDRDTQTRQRLVDGGQQFRTETNYLTLDMNLKDEQRIPACDQSVIKIRQSFGCQTENGSVATIRIQLSVEISNLVPPSSLSVASMSQPWPSAIRRTIARPRPLPLAPVVYPCWKTLSYSCSGIPDPLSAT
jgi:hypothetical protein